MTRKEIIDYLYTDTEFEYHGRFGSFCPVGVFGVAWNGAEYTFATVDEAIDAKVFDGKSLVDIWDEIYPQIAPG